MDETQAKQIILQAESDPSLKNSPQFVQAVNTLMGSSGGMAFLAQHGGSPNGQAGVPASQSLGTESTVPSVPAASTPPASNPTGTPPPVSSPTGSTVGAADPKVSAELNDRNPATTPPVGPAVPPAYVPPTTNPAQTLPPPPDSKPADTSALQADQAAKQNATNPGTPPSAPGQPGGDKVDAVLAMLGKVDKVLPNGMDSGVSKVMQILQDTKREGIPQDPRSLGGGLSGLNSTYLQNTTADDPTLLNEALMARGKPSGSQDLAYLSPIAGSMGGLIKLANSGNPTSQQGQLQTADQLYGGIVGKKGGEGMVDAGALYDNMFNGGTSNDLLQNSQITADKQYGEINSLLGSLGSVIPADSLASIQGQVDKAYLDYSHMVATGQADAGQNGGFLGYLESIGARDWF